MRTLRRLQNYWILWVTTMVLVCFSNAVAQASYRVTDLGAEEKDNLGCAMSVNCPSIMRAGPRSWPGTCHRGSRISFSVNKRTRIDRRRRFHNRPRQSRRKEYLDELGRDQRLRAGSR
jgi:hypothetical protein